MSGGPICLKLVSRSVDGWIPAHGVCVDYWHVFPVSSRECQELVCAKNNAMHMGPLATMLVRTFCRIKIY
jgi:hypothetical protein